MLMVTSLSRDFMPSSWANFAATRKTMPCCTAYRAVPDHVSPAHRMLPMMSMYQVRKLLPFLETRRRNG